jgi:hypothetical protein
MQVQSKTAIARCRALVLGPQASSPELAAAITSSRFVTGTLIFKYTWCERVGGSMKTFGRLAISIANDVVDDTMRVILHESDYPLLEGVISGDRANNQRRVIFLTPEGARSYQFEDVHQALLAFADEMIATQNVTHEDFQRDAE